MEELKPKEWHERHLADVDKVKIEEYLKDGGDQDIAKIAVTLARQCDLFVTSKGSGRCACLISTRD